MKCPTCNGEGHVNRYHPALTKPVRPARPTLNRIVAVIARFYGYTVTEIRSPNRRPYLSRARHIGMFLASEHGYSYPEIAEAFGREDHTTVLYAVRKIEGSLDPTVPVDLERLRPLLTVKQEAAWRSAEEIAGAA
jgi:chromosomal replication initiation ATPase DnaA